MDTPTVLVSIVFDLYSNKPCVSGVFDMIIRLIVRNDCSQVTLDVFVCHIRVESAIYLPISMLCVHSFSQRYVRHFNAGSKRFGRLRLFTR